MKISNVHAPSATAKLSRKIKPFLLKHRVLICESYPTTACILSSKPHIVVAGTRDGGVIVWDLHSSSLTALSANNVSNTIGHIMVQEQETPILEPSYSSFGIHQPDYPHMDEIVSIFPIAKRDTGVHHRGGERPHQQQQTVQIMSIDASGHVQTWVSNGWVSSREACSFNRVQSLRSPNHTNIDFLNAGTGGID